MIARVALPSLSSRDRQTLSRGVIAIVALLVVSKGLPAYRAWLSDTMSARGEILAEDGRAQGLVAASHAIKDSLRARSARVLALAPAILQGDTPGAAAATLTSLVDDAATDAGVSLAAVEIVRDPAQALSTGHTTGVQHEGFARVSVHATLSGDVVAVSQFLSDLEHGPQLLAVRALTISQSEPAAANDQMETLHAEVTVTGLGLGPPRSATAPREAQARATLIPRALSGGHQ